MSVVFSHFAAALIHVIRNMDKLSKGLLRKTQRSVTKVGEYSIVSPSAAAEPVSISAVSLSRTHG